MAADKPNCERKKEEVSPEELWKRVSQQLSSKKNETLAKAAAPYDFSKIIKELSQTTKKRADENMLAKEVENGLFYSLPPPELDVSFSVSHKTDVPSFFPNNPLYRFYDPKFYKNLDLDTLFFIFYYYKGTLQQTYAAIQLKRYAWRFHLKYKMWFQRLDEPKLITPEYEKGEFLFFDYETTWNFMKKNDFVFEYRYLEDIDHF